jgi:hypothetical protein
MDFQALNEKLEFWTRTGKRSLVIEAFKKTNFSKLSLTEKITLGKIANRNHLYTIALKILFRQKQEFDERKEIAPEDFITTYAASLLGLGAAEEAQELLKKIQHHPQALLSYAISFFSSWNYEASLPLLKKYLKLQTDPYMSLVGRINLIAASIGLGDYVGGQAQLRDLIADLKDNPKASVLYGNCWEIQAQIDIESKEYEKALQSLETSKLIFKDQLTRYLLYVNKWEAVAKLALNPESDFNQKRLIEIISQAKSLRNWETIRDSEFQFAKYTGNYELIQKNLLGTPFKGYHQRIEKLYNIHLDKDFHYAYSPENYLSLNTISSIALLEKNDFHEDNLGSSTGVRILNLLLKDFYKPARSGVVHHFLNPETYYNPFSSAHNIRNHIYRFNKSCSANEIPVSIYINHGDIFLKLSNDKAISISAKTRTYKSGKEWSLDQISTHFKGTTFSAAQVAERLKISKRQANYLIKQALMENKLTKINAGRSSLYRKKKKGARS